MMTLTNLETLPGGVKIDYDVSHSIPGREGTTLSANLVLYIRQDKSWCEFKIDSCEGLSSKESLDRMAVWLRRLADGIEQRKEMTIPV